MFLESALIFGGTNVLGSRGKEQLYTLLVVKKCMVFPIAGFTADEAGTVLLEVSGTKAQDTMFASLNYLPFFSERHLRELFALTQKMILVASLTNQRFVLETRFYPRACKP